MAESGISVSPRRTVRSAGIEPEVARLDHGRPFRRAAAGECPQAGEQLGERERLRQVVVRAGVEPGDPIGDGGAGGQHQHRRPDPRSRSVLQTSKPSRPGSITSSTIASYSTAAAIQMRVVARPRDVGCVTLLGQAALEQAAHLHLVLDDEHPHVPHSRAGR